MADPPPSSSASNFSNFTPAVQKRPFAFDTSTDRLVKAQATTQAVTSAMSSPSTATLFGSPLPSSRPLSNTTPSPFVTSPVTSPSTMARPSTSTRLPARLHHSTIFDFSTKVLTIRVGREPSHHDFAVHESLLAHSSYLGEIHHPSASFICLPDQNPAALNVYVQWLYTRALYTRTAAQNLEWRLLVDAYLLGRKLRDEKFQDGVMDAVGEWLREVKDGKDLAVVLEKVGEVYADEDEHALRRFVSDVAATKFSDALVKKIGVATGEKEVPRGFLVDVLGKLSARFQGGKVFGAGSGTPEMRGPCWYHCHAEGECSKEK